MIVRARVQSLIKALSFRVRLHTPTQPITLKAFITSIVNLALGCINCSGAKGVVTNAEI